MPQFNKFSISLKRVRFVISTGILVALYQLVYIYWLYPHYRYFGFNYETLPFRYVFIANLLSILPSCWMPVNLKRPTQFIYYGLYLIVFIPSMFIPLYVAMRPLFEVFILILSLFAGFSFIGLSYFLPLVHVPKIIIPRATYFYILGCLTLILTVWVINIYIGNFLFVSFAKIYEKIRFTGSKIAEGTYINYAILLLSSSINPFLMSWGLCKKKIIIFLIGALGQILLYSTWGSKGILLSIVFLPILFLFIRGRKGIFFLRLNWAVASLFSLFVMMNLFLSDEINAELKIIPAIVFMRAFGIPGLSTIQYYDFFKEHPFTYLSHVNFVGLFIDYPYLQSIGQEIGYFYYKSDINANAHFWATDGIAGFGIPGIIGISMFCFIVFWIIDSILNRRNLVLSSLAISYSGLMMTNISIFTTLLSGGLFASVLILYFSNDKKSIPSLRKVS